MRHDPQEIHSIVAQDGAIILDIENDIFFAANTTGAYIWLRLLKGFSTDTIAMDLSRDTGMDIETVLGDVCAFVAALNDKHLLRS